MANTKDNDESLDEVIEKFRSQENIEQTEGRKGVENLCILVRALGYKDTQYFGQFSRKASFGDLIEFLEDNPGAIDTIIEWIGSQKSPEWREQIASQIEDDEQVDEDEIYSEAESEE